MTPGQEAKVDWFYIGHYGQLGPLTFEQMEELVRDGVVLNETHVWRTGLRDWVRADAVPELKDLFPQLSPYNAPPPPPPLSGLPRPKPAPVATEMALAPTHGAPQLYLERSDRSRLAAGILQLLIPGVGRMYLGYAAHGVMQLFFTPFGCGVGWLWSVIDGIVILSGGVSTDGYGRRLDP